MQTPDTEGFQTFEMGMHDRPAEIMLPTPKMMATTAMVHSIQLYRLSGASLR